MRSGRKPAMLGCGLLWSFCPMQAEAFAKEFMSSSIMSASATFSYKPRALKVELGAAV